MKSIMLSVQPKWVKKILSDEKTIEVRKTAPKLETPFKVYIYKTKKRILRDITKKGELGYYAEISDETRIMSCPDLDGGKVIGEFVCDRIIETIPDYNPKLNKFFNYDFYDENGKRLEDCLTDKEKQEYGKGKPLYGLHISNLKIYDKPKEIENFQTPPCEKSEKACEKCKYLVKIDTPNMYKVDCFVANGRPIISPPQSWCYVEEVEEN